VPNPAQRDPENIQCRAVFIQFPRALVRQQGLASNPFLTRGAVESSLKLWPVR